MGGSASRCHPRPYERTGVVTERREKCAFSITENHLSRRGVGSTTMQACSDRVILAAVKRVKLLYMRPLQWCLKTKGVLPEGKPALHDQGQAAMPTCLGHEEETLVLVSGPGAGSPLSPRMLATDASLTGWDASLTTHDHPARGLWSGHHPVWHFSCLEMLAVFQENPDSYGPVPLTAGPTGEGHGPPHSSVPVSSRCPREISLPTLPVLQGAAVSSEPTPQSSARKRSLAGELTTPVRVSTAAGSAVSCRSSITGHRTSSSNNTRDQSRETGSLSRLFGSMETTAKCICLGPAHCTARLSDSIWCSATTFQRGLPTLVGPEQGLVIEQEVDTLLRKAIEVVPPHDRESGFYSWYFIVLKKEGEVAFRSEGRIPPHIHPSTQEVPEVRIGGEAYQCRVLPSSLALSLRTFTKCVDELWLLWTPGHPYTVLGLRLNAKKSVLSPLQRTTYLGVVWDLTTMQARLSPAQIESILTAVERVRKGRSLTVKQFQQLLGLMAAVSKQRGNPFHASRSHGPGARSSLLPRTLVTDASLTGWGAVMDGHPAHDHVLVRTDSTVVVYYINHQGGLCSRPLYKLAHQILVWSQDKLLSLRAAHIPGHLNLGAELGAHLIAPSLSTEVVKTILQSRAPSSRKLYGLKWKPFTSWCGD
ncbi:30S ribosomal protein S4 [Labeo rohita]|uniref:30S ribosomal protein S4 n=1 Tax=Labeo rohita TaxID=84645 RepID=A0ABQ8L3J0_LABRO|nr:30S ribosomal protein S4 [Labeo rohita]